MERLHVNGLPAVRTTTMARRRERRIAPDLTWIAHAGDRAAIRETRLRIVPARARETLAGLLARTHGRWSMAEAMAANGFGQRRRLAAGEPVNIALDEPYTP